MMTGHHGKGLIPEAFPVVVGGMRVAAPETSSEGMDGSVLRSERSTVGFPSVPLLFRRTRPSGRFIGPKPLCRLFLNYVAAYT